MTIDWTNFSPLTAVLGGVLMGLGAAVLVLFNGRIVADLANHAGLTPAALGPYMLGLEKAS